MGQNYTFFLLVFLISFLLAAIATPLISKVAIKKKILDIPGLHKTHSKPKPLLGGLAIFAGFAITVLIFLDVDEKLLSLVIGTAVLVITGLLDDIYNLKPLIKLAGQTTAAAIVVLGNLFLYRFMLDYFERFYIPNFIVVILIIGWIVLIVNAFNLIDGLDGLAVGTAAIIFLAMIVVSLVTGSLTNVLGVQLIGLGACLGFLIFNFNPSRIFMGDTGSMLLGFILANVHLFTIKYPFDASLVLGSMFIFAYPALDISFAIYRRICNRCSIFKADRGHIHHIFISLGYSVRKTVLLIYAINLVFALMAIILLGLDVPTRLLFVIGVLTALGILFAFKKLLAISEQNGVGTS